MIFFLALIAGFLFGGAIVWLVQRSDIRQAYDRARGELSAQLAGSTERTKSHETRIAELRTELDERDRSIAEMHETVATLKAGVAEKPSIDDGFVTQIMERVQSKLDSSDRSLAKMNETVAALTAGLAEKPAVDDGFVTQILEKVQSKLDSGDRSLAKMNETVAALTAGLAEKPAVDDGFVSQILEKVQSKLDSIPVPESPVPAATLEPVVLPDWSEVLQPLQDSIHNVEAHLRGIDESRTPDRQVEVEQLTQDLQVVRDLGNSVYEALLVFGERFAGIGKSLDLAVECHNEAAIHLENRVIATARRFHQRASENSAFDLVHVADAVREPVYQPLNGK
jgi:hypothetical protein